MTDQELTSHTAAPLRLDVTTNALQNLLSIARNIRADYRGVLLVEELDALDTAFADASAALEIARGSRADIPHNIRSQRMPHDMAQRFLEAGK